jgi:hypothetical protein
MSNQTMGLKPNILKSNEEHVNGMIVVYRI